VPDRDDALGVHGQCLDRRAHVVVGRRPAAAVAEAPVLDVPYRPPARDEVGRERVLEVEPVARAPEPAVDEHGHGVAAREQLAEL
jgi:hypothetical protein